MTTRAQLYSLASKIHPNHYRDFAKRIKDKCKQDAIHLIDTPREIIDKTIDGAKYKRKTKKRTASGNTQSLSSIWINHKKKIITSLITILSFFAYFRYASKKNTPIPSDVPTKKKKERINLTRVFTFKNMNNSKDITRAEYKNGNPTVMDLFCNNNTTCKKHTHQKIYTFNRLQSNDRKTEIHRNQKMSEIQSDNPETVIWYKSKLYMGSFRELNSIIQNHNVNGQKADVTQDEVQDEKIVIAVRNDINQMHKPEISTEFENCVETYNNLVKQYNEKEKPKWYITRIIKYVEGATNSIEKNSAYLTPLWNNLNCTIELEKDIYVFRSERGETHSRRLNIIKEKQFIDRYQVATCGILNDQFARGYYVDLFHKNKKKKLKTEKCLMNHKKSFLLAIYCIKKGVRVIVPGDNLIIFGNSEYEVVIEPGCTYTPTKLENTTYLDYYIEVSK